MGFKFIDPHSVYGGSYIPFGPRPPPPLRSFRRIFVLNWFFCSSGLCRVITVQTVRKWWSSIFQTPTPYNVYGGHTLPPPLIVNAPMLVINRSIFKILESFCRFSSMLSWFVTNRKPPAVSCFYYSCAGGMSLHITTKLDLLTAAHIEFIITFLTRPLIFIQPIKLLLHKYQV